MALTGVVLGLVYPVLYGTMRNIQRADADTQSQQKAVLLVEKFFADFASTNRSSLMVVEALPAASFLSQREMGPQSLPSLRPNDDYYVSTGNTFPVEWKKFVAMRFNAAEKRLERMEFPYAGGSVVACMRPQQLEAVLVDVRYRGSQRVVVGGIEDLKIQAVGDSALSLTITSKQRFDVDKTSKIQVILSMRN